MSGRVAEEQWDEPGYKVCLSTHSTTQRNSPERATPAERKIYTQNDAGITKSNHRREATPKRPTATATGRGHDREWGDSLLKSVEKVGQVKR